MKKYQVTDKGMIPVGDKSIDPLKSFEDNFNFLYPENKKKNGILPFVLFSTIASILLFAFTILYEDYSRLPLLASAFFCLIIFIISFVSIAGESEDKKKFKKQLELIYKEPIFLLYAEIKKLQQKVKEAEKTQKMLENQVIDLEKNFKQLSNPSSSTASIFKKNIEIRKLKISLQPLIKGICLKKIKQSENAISELELLEKIQESNKEANINNDLYENLSNFATESSYSLEIERLTNALSYDDGKYDLEKAVGAINGLINSEESYKNIFEINNEVWEELDNSDDILEIKNKINDLVNRVK